MLIQIALGPYLQGRFPELANTVNAILDGKTPEPTPEPTPDYSYIQFVKDIQIAEGQTGKWIDGIARKTYIRINANNFKI